MRAVLSAVKPENILLATEPPKGSSSRNQKLVVKLADFGIATIIGDQSGAQTYCGTPHYFAPEVHRRSHQASNRVIGGGGSGGPGYGRASDMWCAAGCRPRVCRRLIADADSSAGRTVRCNACECAGR